MNQALLATFEFTDPARLLALAALPVFLYLALRREKVSVRSVAAALARGAIVALLILALAGPVELLPGVGRHVVLVADSSDSAAGSQDVVDRYVNRMREAEGARVSLITFGKPSSNTVANKLPDTRNITAGGNPASNPAEAVLLADALLPDGGHSEIVLLTDARQTAGDLARAAQGVRAPISVVPLTPFAQPEVCLAEVRLAGEDSGGAETLLEATIVANRAAQGELKLSCGGKQVASLPVSSIEGSQRIVVPLPCDRRELTIVTAELAGFEDHFAENNACRLVLPPRQPPRVLIVDEQPATIERFAAALTAGGLDVQTAAPTAETFALASLAGYEVVVLSDVSAAALGDLRPGEPVIGHPPIGGPPLAALESYVRAGGGLVVVGGDGVFGVDALAGTKLESLLPLKASPRAAERNPTLALVLIIDRSRSMLEDNRLELAKRAASQTVDELSPDDKVGVMAFGTNHDWITEIVPVGDKTELKRRIATLEAEGQTDMYPALERAYLALEQADADRRHAIVLTDGVSTPGDFDTIARRMSDAGITVSTVSVSPGAEQQILKDIARLAGGEHYHCDDAADIVSILVRDTRRVETAAREYAPIVHQPLPGLDVSRAPALLGYVPTSPHGGAQLLLRTEGGDPLLAWRRHGRGMTVAFPADVKDRWGANWQSWPGLADFWSRLARYARRRAWAESQVSIRRQGNRATVSLDLLDDRGDDFAPVATLRPFDASGAALAPQSISLVRTAPRHYEAEIDAALGSLCAVEVEVPSDGTGPRRKTVSLAHDYDDELLLGPAEESLLRIVSKQTGGRFAPAPDDVAVGRIEPRGTPTPLWRYFVLGAAVLLVVDVFVRRGPFLIGGRRTEDGGRRAEDGG